MTTPKNEFRHIGYLNKSQIVVGRNVDCTTRRRSYDLVSPVDVIWRRRIRRRRLIQRNRKTFRVDDQLWGGVTSSQSNSLHDAKILFFFTHNFILPVSTRQHIRIKLFQQFCLPRAQHHVLKYFVEIKEMFNDNKREGKKTISTKKISVCFSSWTWLIAYSPPPTYPRARLAYPPNRWVVKELKKNIHFQEDRNLGSFFFGRGRWLEIELKCPRVRARVRSPVMWWWLPLSMAWCMAGRPARSIGRARANPKGKKEERNESWRAPLGEDKLTL